MKNIFIFLFSLICFAKTTAQQTVVNLNQQAIIRPARTNMITVLQDGKAKRMNEGEFEDSLRSTLKNDSFANVFGNSERVGQTRFGIGLNTIFSKTYQFGQNPMDDTNVFGSTNIKVFGIGSSTNYMSSLRNVITAGGVRKRNDLIMYSNVDYPKATLSFANDTGVIMRTTLSNRESFYLNKNSKGSIVFTETDITNVIKQTGLEFSEKMPTIPNGSNILLQSGAIISVKDSQRLYVKTDNDFKKVAYTSDVSGIADSLLSEKNRAVSVEATKLNIIDNVFFKSGASSFKTGSLALGKNTGGGNIGIGNNALAENTVSNNNIAIGENALSKNFFSSFYSSNAQNNTAIGNSSLRENTTGGSNCSVGSISLRLNTTGSFNTSFGGQSMTANTTGSYNTAIGYQSLINNTLGNHNTVVGAYAGNGYNGSNNVIIGKFASSGYAQNYLDNQLNIQDWIKGDNGKIAITTMPTYMTDADADADATLKSGSFYMLTVGRGVFRKP